MSATTWNQRHEKAKTEAWHAIYDATGTGPMETFELGHVGGKTPQPLADLAMDLSRALMPLVTSIARGKLDDEALDRVMLEASRGATFHALYAVAHAMADEIARPDRLPFVPPHAGSWVRSIWAGRTRHAWHRFSGDLRPGDVRTQEVRGRTMCGVWLYLRGQSLFDPGAAHSYAVADEQPAVAVCAKCRRSAPISASGALA